MTQRGRLRVYLGAAPGVGKTYRMLDEGNRRSARGTDVVVAYVETHGRAGTEERLGALTVLPRRELTYRGAQLTELDLAAVMARRPEVALVDELAHTNVPGAGNDKRWQDVEELLAAGIDVISTVNVQHLESLNDVVAAITGVPQRETVPDSIVRSAEQIELVDMTPEALRRRMAHGNVYSLDKVDAALSHYFRPGNLTALRELALLWLADSVEDGMARYRAQHGIDATWETRERIVVAVTGGPEGEALIRRAARIADRSTGAELLAVHIARSDGLAGSSIASLDGQRLLVESLGGSYHSIVGDDIPAAVLQFAQAKNATQIVIGASRRNPAVAALTGPGTGMTITRHSGSIDVHVVSHDYIGRGRRLPRVTRGLTVRRRLLGVLVAAVLLVVLTVICVALRGDLALASEVLLYLLVVVICSLVGGFYPALVAAVAASALLNYYFVPPTHRFLVNSGQNVLALVVFVIIAALVSRVVDEAARRNVEAARSNAEAETLSTLAGSLLRGEQALPALMERIRETFAVADVSLLRADPESRGAWSVLAEVGEPLLRPDDGDTAVAVSDDLTLVLRGRRLAAEDQRMLTAFATEVAVAYRQRQLTAEADTARGYAETDRTRTALLNAVSHDLRTPLAAAKAAVSSLRSVEVTWSEGDRTELLHNADTALDRLTALVTNLLDLSRIEAGALTVNRQAVGLDDVLSMTLAYVDGNELVRLDVSPELPEVLADVGLLERVLANVLQNALRYSPPGATVLATAGVLGTEVELRIIDQGPGIPATARETVFEAFQRRDDRSVSTGAGVGLGLAIARGFVEAMGGRIALEDTPGGGLIVTIALQVAP